MSPNARVTAFETDRLGSTCFQLRRAAMANGCMLKMHGRFSVISEMAGVEVVNSTPGPYISAFSADIPPYHSARVINGGRILVSKRSSRGEHDMPVNGLVVDDMPFTAFYDAVMRASMLIGPNSGAVHFAALFGCRTIVYDTRSHNSMLPEGDGHWAASSKSGLMSILNGLDIPCNS